jgi:hypothetical protein
MPVGFATSPTTGQGFCFIAASWIWVGLEEKITVKLTKSQKFKHSLFYALIIRMEYNVSI